MHYEKNKIILDKNRYKNFVRILDADRELQVLDFEYPTGKGPNSSVYKLVDPAEDGINLVIKICNTPAINKGSYSGNLQKRFKREIEALEKVRTAGRPNVIRIFDKGELRIDDRYFLYYVMEFAESDLRKYLNQNELSNQEKLKICKDILNAVKELHDLGIYHRDIKPDNFFIISGTWKIGDLGLIAYRDEDSEIDKYSGAIGPKGFMSPEATNRAYFNHATAICKADCKIDNKSDIYQLGKLFWYVLQGDVPTGQVAPADFIVKAPRLFSDILVPMLQYSKSRRPDIGSLEASLLPICKEYAAI